MPWRLFRSLRPSEKLLPNLSQLGLAELADNGGRLWPAYLADAIRQPL
jgi:hypothetical protein